jgi:hypothetical protein
MSSSRIRTGDSLSSGCESPATRPPGLLSWASRAPQGKPRSSWPSALRWDRSPGRLRAPHNVDSESISWVRETAGAAAARSTRARLASPGRKIRRRRKSALPPRSSPLPTKAPDWSGPSLLPSAPGRFAGHCAHWAGALRCFRRAGSSSRPSARRAHNS